MKRLMTPCALLIILGICNANAQNVGQAVKSKADLVKNATVNNAVNGVANDPVGSAGKLIGMFHKNKNQAPAATTPTPVATAATNGGGATTNAVTNNNMVAGTGTASAPNTSGMISGNSKTINNGLVFSIIQCTGDRAGQTITITYTISNPTKPNQAILVGALQQYAMGSQGSAIDDNGNTLKIGSISMASKTEASVLAELPTGIKLKGTITLINALPTSNNLQIFKVAVASNNLQGGGDKQGTNVEERNIPVVWSN